jgi:hypothetical protein
MNETISLTEAEIGAEIERLRRKSRTLFVAGFVVLGAAIVAVLIAAWVVGGGDNLPPLALIPYSIVVIVSFILIFTGNGYKKKLKKFIGEHVIKSILGEFFEVESYDTASRIPEEIIKGTGLIGGWDHSRGSDHLIGSYKSRKIELSDITLYYEERTTDSDGDTHEREVIVFAGQWLICDFGKELPAKLRIRENLGKLTGGYSKDGDDLDTENVAFNERYQVLADDPHTAFYVLTPHFMERILALDEKAHGRLHLCFEGSRVHIAVGGGDLLEVSTKSADYKNLDDLRSRFRGDIHYLTDLLDILFPEENSGT